jgi:broad specificity phosphatase PhoE
MRKFLIVGFIVALLCLSYSHAVLAHKASTDVPIRSERILLMRHAEKPADDSDPNLTAEGYHRAQELADFIPAKFGRPDYIFVAANSKKSMRPYETAVPLSQATKTPIDTSFRDKDFKQLAAALLQDDRFANKLVVVIWHHGNIPEFAHDLEAKDGSYPDEWPKYVFNQILQFDYTGRHHPIVTAQTEPF